MVRVGLLAAGLLAAVVGFATLLPEIEISPTRIPIPADEAIVNGGEGPVTRTVSWSPPAAGDVIAFDSRNGSPLGAVLWILDPADGSVRGQLTVGATPQAVQSPDGEYLYLVARTIGSDGTSVQMASAIALATGDVLWEREVAWPGRTTALTPNSIAVSGDGSRVYVAALTSHLGEGIGPRITILNAATGKRQRSVPGPGECADEPARLFNGVDRSSGSAVAVCQILNTILDVDPVGENPYRAMALDLPAPRPRPYEMVFDPETGILRQFTSDADVTEIDVRTESYIRQVDLDIGMRFIESLNQHAPAVFDGGSRLVVPIDSRSHCAPDGDSDAACLVVTHDLASSTSRQVVVDRPIVAVAPDDSGPGFFLADGTSEEILRFDRDGDLAGDALTIGTSITGLLRLR